MSVTAVATDVLSIVIPAYNEERSIRDIIERVLKVRETFRASADGPIGDVELIVVDDASSDGTAEVVGSFTDVRLIRHGANKGYGGALKTGFAAATGDYIGFLDADGTYPPEHFPGLCDALFRDGADVVIGSRMHGAESAMPLSRYVGNRLFAWLLSWIAGRKVTDTASGMRVFRKSVLKHLGPLPDGLHLTPAMSTKALHEGMKVVEVAIPYAERAGRSKLNVVSDGFRFLNIIIGIARLYNPLKFFGSAGLVALAVAGVLSVEPVAYYLQFRRVEDTGIYRLFAIMVLGIAGLNLMTFGAFANFVLEIVHGRPAGGGAPRRRLISRGVITRSGLLGSLLMVSAVALNVRTISQYVATGSIYVHWVYILTGAMLFLVGLQLAMGSVLVGILQELNEVRGPVGEA